MKFTFWDQLFLNVTGRLPKKTQAEVDKLLELKAMIARATEAESRARVEAAEKRRLAKEASKIDLVKPEKAASKKKADSTKKKPSKS